jgi:hypothetical protein
MSTKLIIALALVSALSATAYVATPQWQQSSGPPPGMTPFSRGAPDFPYPWPAGPPVNAPDPTNEAKGVNNGGVITMF